MRIRIETEGALGPSFRMTLGPGIRRGNRGVSSCVAFLLPGEGARLKSHGETLAGLIRSLKDDAPRRRAAAARRAVLD